MARHSQDPETVLLVTLSDHDIDELEALADGADMHTEETAWLNGNEHLPVPYPSQVLALIAEVRRLRKIEAAAKEWQATADGDDHLTHDAAVGLLDAALAEEGE